METRLQQKQPGFLLGTDAYGAPCSKEAIDPGRVDE